jgi:dipeptidyl aminopeptidase/acylaminoacyl peptidase
VNTQRPESLDDVVLIPRDLLFGNPDKASLKVSPDGRHLSWIAPVDGVLNVWVAPESDPTQATPVTGDTGRGIRDYAWSYLEGVLIYLQDIGGDEDFHLYGVDVESLSTMDLTPYDKTTAYLVSASHHEPGRILVAMNDRDQAWHDLYSVDLRTGARELLELNTERIASYFPDGQFRIAHALRVRDDGGVEVLRRDDDAGWEVLDSVPFEESATFSLRDPTFDGSVIYLEDGRGRDTSALFELDLATGERRLLFADEQADVGGVLRDPQTRRVQAVGVNYLRQNWSPVSQEIAEDLEWLADRVPGDLGFESRTLDDMTWILSGSASDGPVTYYRYQRGVETELTRLFSTRPWLEDKPLVPRRPVEVESRDGLKLVSYLAVPAYVDIGPDGRASSPTPMVVLVHGGPWHRDVYGYDPWVQWLANRGYSVLQVNFRGSTGFGKDFINAGNGEWAGRMHDDVLDGVEWAIDHGITNRDTVGIMGGSYGGYATLVGLTFTPEVFACGVDIVGPSNLHTLLATTPAYWASFYELLVQRMGDPRTEEGRAWLTERSPLNKVEEIVKPLLIGQGANDPRVKQAESDQIVEAMTSKGIPVTYMLFPDEGHGFARPENSKAMNAAIEGFLSAHLGGRAEPFGGDLQGSSLHVPVGAEQVPGLEEALSLHTPTVRG